MKSKKALFSLTLFPVIVFLAILLSVPAWANIKQIKAYKEAYPDEKPKCAYCHAVEKPKKEDGQHDLNDYGKKVVAIKAEPDADTYKAAGK